MGLLVVVWVGGVWNVVGCGGDYVIWDFEGGGLLIIFFICNE